jgi:hypothetical protein
MDRTELAECLFALHRHFLNFNATGTITASDQSWLSSLDEVLQYLGGMFDTRLGRIAPLLRMPSARRSGIDLIVSILEDAIVYYETVLTLPYSSYSIVMPGRLNTPCLDQGPLPAASPRHLESVQRIPAVLLPSPQRRSERLGGCLQVSECPVTAT